MWVSRKRFEDLEKRVKELEYATSVDGVGFEGGIVAWFKPSNLKINQVVEMLANEVGVKFKGCAPRLVVRK
jgi:hypothetical protein